MTNYERGRRFEYRVRDLFRDHGFLVIRAAQSKPVDLVCVKKGRLVLVECKTSKRGLGPRAREESLKAVEFSEAELIFAYREKRKIKLIDARTNSPYMMPS